MKKGLYDDDDFSFENYSLNLAESQSAATQAMAS